MDFSEITGVIFDKDGTLADFDSLWIPAAVKVVEKLVEAYHMDPSSAVKILRSFGVNEDGSVDPKGQLAIGTYESMAGCAVEIMKDDGIACSYETVFAQMSEWFEKAVDEGYMTCSYPCDLSKLFGYLNERGIHTAVATTDNLANTHKLLNRAGIDAELICASDSAYPIKPDPSFIHDCADRWGVDTGRIVMVGDTPNDMKFAENGGAMKIGVLSGATKKEELAQYADIVISHVGELMKLL